MSDSRGRRRVLVVAALVTREGRILVTQRAAGQPMGGQWEFPGGKMEAGESPGEALSRELREELAVDVEVGRIWDVLFHRYPDYDVLMLVFGARLRGPGEPMCRQVAALAWRAPEALLDLDFLAADRPLVDRLAKEGVPTDLFDSK